MISLISRSFHSSVFHCTAILVCHDIVCLLPLSLSPDPKRDVAAKSAPGVLELPEDVPQIELAEMLSDLNIDAPADDGADPAATSDPQQMAGALQERMTQLNAEHERVKLAFDEAKTSLEVSVQKGLLTEADAVAQFELVQKEGQERVAQLQAQYQEAEAALHQLQTS